MQKWFHTSKSKHRETPPADREQKMAPYRQGLRYKMMQVRNSMQPMEREPEL